MRHDPNRIDFRKPAILELSLMVAEITQPVFEGQSPKQGDRRYVRSSLCIANGMLELLGIDDSEFCDKKRLGLPQTRMLAADYLHQRPADVRFSLSSENFRRNSK